MAQSYVDKVKDENGWIHINTYWVRIYMAGSIEQIKQICRRECKKDPLCVTVMPTEFIYDGGEEQGVVVELINYPKFPQSPEDINKRARELATILRDEAYQDSVLTMNWIATSWKTDREPC